MLVAFVGLALGQPIATPEVVLPIAETSKWLEPENLKILLGIFGTIVTVAAPFLLKGWHSLIVLAKKKSNNELVSQILDRVDVSMPAIVKAVYDEFVRDAKVKAKDGKLTQEEIKEAQKRAFSKAKAIAGPAAMAMLTKDGIDLKQYVEGLAGVHVEHAKKMFNKDDKKN
jgi:hypothetical protein